MPRGTGPTSDSETMSCTWSPVSSALCPALANWKCMGLSTKVRESDGLQISRVSLGKLLKLAEPQLPYLTSGNNNRLVVGNK